MTGKPMADVASMVGLTTAKRAFNGPIMSYLTITVTMKMVKMNMKYLHNVSLMKLGLWFATMYSVFHEIRLSNLHCRSSSLVFGTQGKIVWTSVTVEIERVILSSIDRHRIKQIHCQQNHKFCLECHEFYQPPAESFTTSSLQKYSSCSFNVDTDFFTASNQGVWLTHMLEKSLDSGVELKDWKVLIKKKT